MSPRWPVEWTPAAICSGFILALAVPWLVRLNGRAARLIVSVLPLLLFAYFAGFIGTIAEGKTLSAGWNWAPELDLRMSVFLDGLSLLMALLISGIGTLVFVYTGGYMKGEARLGQFYAFLLIFMSSMLGLVLSDNLLALFIFWELTSLSSYLLIGFHHTNAEARKSAQQSLLVTALGGIAMLAGLMILGSIGGGFELSSLIKQKEVVQAHSLYFGVFGLVLCGAASKSAQFPFHFWLPNAMEAPTPVSAYLHSATMVNAGVYLLARLHPVLGGTSAWFIVVTVIGAVTMLLGGCLALLTTDSKRMLAYFTVSALGMMFMLLGIGSHEAVTACLAFLLAHALYKGALFMTAGAIDHTTGTRDLQQLRGLRRSMPMTAVAAALAGVSLAAVGPVLSFVAKEKVLKSVLHIDTGAFALATATVIAAAAFAAGAWLIGVRPFIGTTVKSAEHESEWTLWFCPLLLAISGWVLGVTPGWLGKHIVEPSAVAVMGRGVPVDLKLWHGITPPLLLSILALALGAGIIYLWTRILKSKARWETALSFGPERLYRVSFSSLERLSAILTGRLQTGYLRHYLLMLLITTVVLTGYTLIASGISNWPSVTTRLRFYEAGLAIIILAATANTLRSTSRLSVIASLSVVGFGVALLFVLFSAPDLAMTQFLIETLLLVLLVAAFHRLPKFVSRSPGWVRIRDACIAGAAGVIVTILVWTASVSETQRSMAEYFARNSLPEAHGRNIVNVILVDFRAFDTLGEITVLATAAMGVFALMKLSLRHKGKQ